MHFITPVDTIHENGKKKISSNIFQNAKLLKTFVFLRTGIASTLEEDSKRQVTLNTGFCGILII
jgi:hypothetical protein